jgi:N-methylhydantoinase B
MRLSVRRKSGEVEFVHVHAVGVTLSPGDHFEMICATGGGYGDPLDRDPQAVLQDLKAGRVEPEAAGDVYGVEVTEDGTLDAAATVARRKAIGQARLKDARAAKRRPPSGAVAPSAPAQPLYPGVVQRGHLAIAEQSGAVLAVAPHSWLDGCPVLETPVAAGDSRVVVRAHLDPSTGRMLLVDVVRPGDPPSIEVAPARWADAARETQPA